VIFIETYLEVLIFSREEFDQLAAELTSVRTIDLEVASCCIAVLRLVDRDISIFWTIRRSLWLLFLSSDVVRERLTVRPVAVAHLAFIGESEPVLVVEIV
jgi:hypothetical protein